MGTKESPGDFDCHRNAADDEPLFTLRANDELAPGLVYEWAARYLTMKGSRITDKQIAKAREALKCAEDMRLWKINQESARDHQARVAQMRTFGCRREGEGRVMPLTSIPRMTAQTEKK